ncbi:DNA internalization-related competence protein ComEC/Rec2 [Pasteurella langaaensis]|nr:DNA internalization-related competence protein ComEC/Rec2 [Pasteurella langaaensis]
MLNLDRCALICILMGLSLLFTPSAFLFPWQNWALLIIGLTLAALCLYLLGYLQRHYRLQTFLLELGIALLALGYFQSSALHIYQQANNVTAHKATQILRIEEILHQQDYQTLMATAQTDEKAENQARIYVNWAATSQPKVGEIWQVEGKVRPLSARLNQGGFDRQQWYFAKGITAVMNVKSAVKIAEDFSWRERRFYAALANTESLSQQGLLLALGFGERAWQNSQTWQVYQKTNTAHLIAISGLHIGLAMLLGFGLARLVQITLPTTWISPYFPLFCGVAFALLYAQLAGFAMPTFRAILALLGVLLLRLWRGYCTAWQLFARVIAVLLLCDPLMLLSSSFWLSIGAVASLIVWYQIFPLRFIQWRGTPLSSMSWKVRWIFSLFHLQCGLLWLFTPIQLAIFAGFSLYGLVANFIAVPVYSFLLVPLVLFATLTNNALFSWNIANFIADFITTLLANFEQGWITLNDKTMLILTALLALLFWLSVHWFYGNSRLQKKSTRYFSFIPDCEMNPALKRRITMITMGIILFCVGRVGVQIMTEPQWRMENLDVGQGLAVLIVKNGRAVLYDTGTSWRNGSMAQSEIVPYLQRQGIILDWLILSHDDNDHSGGATTILQQFPQAKLMTASYKNYGKTDRTFCQAGEQWTWQGLIFSILSPYGTVERADNPHSCVILLSDGKHHVLFTGDADTAAEQQFVAQLPSVDVLQIGHHGSKTSTGKALIDKAKPKISVISSGRWNPWGFPHQQVLERLEKAQSAVKNTAVSGQISIGFSETGINVYSARSYFSPWFRGFIGESSK